MIDETVQYPVGDNPPTARLIYGVDVRTGLELLPDDSVQTICTSPPYFGLRDYGTGTWVGGDPNCTHYRESKHRGDSKYTGQQRWAAKMGGVGDAIYKDVCKRCGAKRKDDQIGLETTVGDFVKALVEVFDGCRRVLRNDGTLWVNLGDTYAMRGVNIDAASSLKSKDLMGIPWRVAFALQEAGWYLRNEIIWSKANPMPDPVSDRCTRSHEHVFLFAHPDSGGKYHYDQDLIRDPVRASTIERNQYAWNNDQRTHTPTETRGVDHRDSPVSVNTINKGCNKRTVWNVNPKRYKGAHFACWPTKLVKPMVLAGCPKGGVVLDPFSGSATTGEVALSLGRNYVGIDLNESYFPLAVARIEGRKAKIRSVETAPSVSTLDLFGVEND